MKGTSKNEERSVWERATAIDPLEAAARERARRRMGVILGALLGLAFGVVTQMINRVAVPGIPLYQPPVGPFGNILLSGVMGAALGALTCYPASAALGILLGGLASLVGILVYMLLRLGSLGFGGALVSSVIFSVPMAWLTIPVLALLRWVSERQVDAGRSGDSLLVRARLPVAIILVMAFLGSFELMPAEARGNLRQTDDMLRTGLSSASAAALPEPLRGPYVTTFPPAQKTGYTLEWTRYDLDRFNELRPPSNFDQHAAVIARFPGSYYLVCVYPTPRQQPNCASYDKLPNKAPERRDD